MQQLVERGRIDAPDRLLARDRALAGKVDGDADRRLGRPLSGPGLQHVEAAVLDGELHVLHVPVMGLEPVAHREQVAVRLRHHRVHRSRPAGERHRGPDPGHDVLALGVHEVLAVEPCLPG